jgi:hypothetical protein
MVKAGLKTSLPRLIVLDRCTFTYTKTNRIFVRLEFGFSAELSLPLALWSIRLVRLSGSAPPSLWFLGVSIARRRQCSRRAACKPVGLQAIRTQAVDHFETSREHGVGIADYVNVFSGSGFHRRAGNIH